MFIRSLARGCHARSVIDEGGGPARGDEDRALRDRRVFAARALHRAIPAVRATNQPAIHHRVRDFGMKLQCVAGANRNA